MYKKRILFICWGYSIHSKRRIEIFLEDELFDVGVVSTYNYDFRNAKNFLLTDARNTDLISRRCISHNLKYVGKYLDYFLALFSKINTNLNIIKIIKWINLICNSSIVKKEQKSDIKKKLILKSLISQRFRKESVKSINDLNILEKSIKDFNPDVIFLQTMLYPCYLYLVAKKRIPFLVTFWNGDLQWKAKWKKIDDLIKNNIVFDGVNKAKIITVNSHKARNICIKYGANKKNVKLIRYPGVDVNLFKPHSKESSKKILNLRNAKMVLWPRGLGQYLNSEVIIKCASYVLNRFPDTIFLVLIGNDNNEEIEKHINLSVKLRVSESFIWKKRVDWNMMPLYYNAADLTISLSSKDSFPNCMIESMACKTPVIMGDIPVIREWIDDRKNGFLVKLNDPIALSNLIISVFSMDKSLLDGICDKAFKKTVQKANYRINKIRIKEIVKSVDQNN